VLLTELPDEDTLAMREEAEIEARYRRAAEQGDPGAMSALGTLLLRRGDLDGAEPFLRAAVQNGDRAAATTWDCCCISAGAPTRRPTGGGSRPSPVRLPPRTRSAGTTRARGRAGRRVLAAAGRGVRSPAGAYALADLLDHRRTRGPSVVPRGG